MENEIWLPVAGYEGVYEVSNLGRLKSLSRLTKSKGDSFSLRKDKVLRLSFDKDGYHIFTISNNKAKQCARIHRLVAIAFIPNPDNKPFVNHKNGIKNDNRAENLEWCTAAENTRHSYDVLKRVSAGLGKIGIGHHLSRKIEQVCMSSGDVIAEYWGTGEIRKKHGYDQSAVLKVCNGKTKQYRGFYWRFSTDQKREKYQNKQPK